MMLNSLAGGKKIVQRTVIRQLLAALVLALVWLPSSWQAATAAAAGCAMLALSNWLGAQLVLTKQVSGAGVALTRVLLAAGLKWVLVLLTSYVLVMLLKFSAAALLTGVIAAVLVQLASSLRA